MGLMYGVVAVVPERSCLVERRSEGRVGIFVGQPFRLPAG